MWSDAAQIMIDPSLLARSVKSVPEKQTLPFSAMNEPQSNLLNNTDLILVILVHFSHLTFGTHVPQGTNSFKQEPITAPDRLPRKRGEVRSTSMWLELLQMNISISMTQRNRRRVCRSTVEGVHSTLMWLELVRATAQWLYQKERGVCKQSFRVLHQGTFSTQTPRGST